MCLMIKKVVRSSGLRKNRLVLLVHCSLDLGLGGVQAWLLLGEDDPEVVGGRVDLGHQTPGFGREPLRDVAERKEILSVARSGGLKKINY